MIREHHKKAIENLKNKLYDNTNYLALIVSGSIAKDRAREDSDLDVIIIASDEEWERRKIKKEYSYFVPEGICNYPGGYVDGKVVNLQFLIDAASHGSEPARSAFIGSFIVYSHVPELEQILNRIPVYQESEQAEKIRSFHAQVKGLQWFIGEAERDKNTYLLVHSVSDMVLFGSRLILAYNKVLFPCHKSLMRELTNISNKPDNLIQLSNTLLEKPGKANADLYCECIFNFTNWDKWAAADWVPQFIEDSEWNWIKSKPPVEDW